MNFVEGTILHINKPYGMSSFGALAFVRTRISKAAGVERVKTGHAATLDPLATGVLILCTGKCTKMIPTLQYDSKEYTATLQFGATTASYDMEHPVNQEYPSEHITEELLRETLKQFEGDIMQVPPVYSAVHVNGKRAYDLARKIDPSAEKEKSEHTYSNINKEAADSALIEEAEKDIPAKPVHVDEIELLWFDNEKKQAQIRVACGKGTYIRSLARDIGKAVGSGAYLTQLCRTRLGDVRIEDCIKLDDFEEWLGVAGTPATSNK